MSTESSSESVHIHAPLPNTIIDMKNAESPNVEAVGDASEVVPPATEVEAVASNKTVISGINTAWLAVHWILVAFYVQLWILYSYQHAYNWINKMPTLKKSSKPLKPFWKSRYNAVAYLVDIGKHYWKCRSNTYKDSFDVSKVVSCNAEFFMILVIFSLAILVGPKRQMRGKLVACLLMPFTGAFAVISFATFTIFKSYLSNNLFAIISFVNLLSLVTQTCTIVGLFLNGHPAAEYLLPYYHIVKSE